MFAGYRCKCGWLYVQLNDDLWYGPIWDDGNGYPSFMTLEEFIEQRPDCAPIRITNGLYP